MKLFWEYFLLTIINHWISYSANYCFHESLDVKMLFGHFLKAKRIFCHQLLCIMRKNVYIHFSIKCTIIIYSNTLNTFFYSIKSSHVLSIQSSIRNLVQRNKIFGGVCMNKLHFKKQNKNLVSDIPLWFTKTITLSLCKMLSIRLLVYLHLTYKISNYLQVVFDWKKCLKLCFVQVNM